MHDDDGNRREKEGRGGGVKAQGASAWKLKMSHNERSSARAATVDWNAVAHATRRPLSVPTIFYVRVNDFA